MLKEFGDFIRDSKIISRLTASSVVLSGMYLIFNHISSNTIQPEIIALGSGIVGSASTFLFMSEAK